MVSFEVSLGNAGNGVDGELTTGNKSENFDNDDESKFILTHLSRFGVEFLLTKVSSHNVIRI